MEAVRRLRPWRLLPGVLVLLQGWFLSPRGRHRDGAACVAADGGGGADQLVTRASTTWSEGGTHAGPWAFASLDAVKPPLLVRGEGRRLPAAPRPWLRSTRAQPSRPVPRSLGPGTLVVAHDAAAA